MATKWISKKTTKLYEGPTGGAQRMVLIFGDTVETEGPPVGDREPVRFRGRLGYVLSDALQGQPALELYFIDVGQGDSTFIVTPGGNNVLIDGGVDKRALGFLSWKYRLDNENNNVDIDLLVLSHADGDHINGLIPILQNDRITVKRVIHSGIATFRPGIFNTRLGKTQSTGNKKFLKTIHTDINQFTDQQLTEEYGDWIQAIQDEHGSPDYDAVRAGDHIDVGDPAVEISVLGPKFVRHRSADAYPWYGDSHTINGHSVVLKLTYDDVSVLLPGDMNIQGAKHLLSDDEIAADLGAHVFKAPHHGSHQYHRPFLEAVRPQVSIISSGDEPDHGHPRAVFIGGVGAASRSTDPLVFSTEIAATFVEADDVVMVGATSGAEATQRQLFKKRLNGMINVRTDGRDIYAARRVASGYWWESYGPVKPAT